MTNINKSINNGAKKMNHQDLYTQQVIKGLESFIPAPESDNNKQTNVSKMSKIGRKLPGIKRMNISSLIVKKIFLFNVKD
ncbi:hypothetical protein BDCR2A_01657 [Borrelia duttonii CR2A]|uniref:Uncharacterized protein n=1 Tax=Borrelia duttonii CR2A TaxID=1432657 RepID=W6TJQ5_9SPIR|nr:hypothetical protein BDCR2A_01657 [Borrelia duttonii CR2A]